MTGPNREFVVVKKTLIFSKKIINIFLKKTFDWSESGIRILLSCKMQVLAFECIILVSLVARIMQTKTWILEDSRKVSLIFAKFLKDIGTASTISLTAFTAYASISSSY